MIISINFLLKVFQNFADVILLSAFLALYKLTGKNLENCLIYMHAPVRATVLSISMCVLFPYQLFKPEYIFRTPIHLKR